MADPFVDLPIIVDSTSLTDNAIESLRAAWTDWEPNDGDPEVILIETLGDIASDVAAQAAQMPSEAMIALGDLLGVQYQIGTPAQALITLHAIDNRGYTIPGGSQVAIDGFTFVTASDAVITAGTTSLSGVVAYADHNGIDADGLIGNSVASLTIPAYITNVTLDSPTSGGADDEDVTAYRNRIARDRRLTARTLITLSDAVAVALDTPGIGRATAIRAGARAVTIAVTDPLGAVAGSTAKTALAATYADLLGDRLVNSVYTIVDPTFSTVNVTWNATALPSVDKTALRTLINQSLTNLLSPLQWGAPNVRGPISWENTPIVAVNDAVARIGAIIGVQRVNSVVLSSPTGGTSVDGAGNLTMAGSVPLPHVGTLTGTVA